MKIKKNNQKGKFYLLLKENDSIIILADYELKSSISIHCKNKKLFVTFLEDPISTKEAKKKSDHSL